MLGRTWTVELSDGPHRLRLEHGLWTGRKSVYLDDEILADIRKEPADFGSDVEFSLRGKPFHIRVRMHGFRYSYELAEGPADPAWMDPGRWRLPGWVRLCQALIIAIPAVALGRNYVSEGLHRFNAWCALILALVGSLACTKVVKDAALEERAKQFLCFGIVIVSWLAFWSMGFRGQSG